MKRLLYLLFFLLLLYNSPQMESQIYFGLGPSYMLPQTNFKEVNKETFGLNIQLESRVYCKLWYGLRFDYHTLAKVDEIVPEYFEEYILISPQIRYNLFCADNYTNKIIPYLQFLFNISSIEGTDQRDRLGLGLSGGLGLSFGFELFNKCWLFDLNGIYAAPNAITRAEGRQNLQSINISLTLSIGL